MQKDILTNEQLHKKFSSNFDLVTHAIHMARGSLHEGEMKTLDMILDELAKEPSHL